MKSIATLILLALVTMNLMVFAAIARAQTVTDGDTLIGPSRSISTGHHAHNNGERNGIPI